MANNFDLSALALQGLCPSNEILYDDVGQPSIMVKIPKMTYAQLGMGDSTAVHPAFIVNGSEIDAIYISKYENVVYNSRAYSLPGRGPATSITFNDALTYCQNKGEGWHLMTRMEWGLIQRVCEANGYVPNGNNYYGRDANETAYKAIPTYRSSSNQVGRVATGTGPLSWSHDGEPDGIWDLKGNVWEWQGGIRMVYGEVQILANNNGADSANSQGASSTAWKAISAEDGSLIEPDGSGTTSGSVKLDYVSSTLTYTAEKTSTSTSECASAFRAITRTEDVSDAAWAVLQDLGLVPYSSEDLLAQGTTNLSYMYINSSEKVYRAGGRWDNANFGFATVHTSSSRAGADDGMGFRSAYCDLPSA